MATQDDEVRDLERRALLDPNDVPVARKLAGLRFRLTGDCGVADLRKGWKWRCGNRHRTGPPRSFVEACSSCRLRHLRDLAVDMTYTVAEEFGQGRADMINWVRDFKLWGHDSIRDDVRAAREADYFNNRRTPRGVRRLTLITRLLGESLGHVFDVRNGKSEYSSGIAWRPGNPPEEALCSNLVYGPEESIYYYWLPRSGP